MEIPVRIRRLHAQLESDEYYGVCGNSGDTIRFDFDAEWEQYPEKTACVVSVSPQGQTLAEIPFQGNICTLPPIHQATLVLVSVRAGALRTTAPARIPYRTCITDFIAEESYPQPDFYNRLLAALARQPAQDLCNGRYLVSEADDYLVTVHGDYIMTKE